MPNDTRAADYRPRTIGYVRASTEDQSITLDVQREKIELYAKLHDLDLIDVVVDSGVSGKTLDRPGLQGALAVIAAGKADALLVAKLDRLTRRVADIGTLVERYFAPGEAALFSVADNIDTRSAGGRLVLNVLTSVAQWERESIVDRTSAALQHKKAKGEVYGTTPFGFDRDGSQLVPNPVEQAVVAEIKAWRAAGLSMHRIADRLNEHGTATKKGGRWFASTVKAILDNKIHA